MKPYSKEDIAHMLHAAVKDVTGLTILSDDDSLISSQYGIHPANFLYIFDILEKQLGIPTADVFKNSHYSIMTVSHLSSAFYEMLPDICE